MKNKVKILRYQSSLKQQELADKVGATRQTISLIEKEEYNPSLKLCLSICYALGKILYALISGSAIVGTTGWDFGLLVIMCGVTYISLYSSRTLQAPKNMVGTKSN